MAYLPLLISVVFLLLFSVLAYLKAKDEVKKNSIDSYYKMKLECIDEILKEKSNIHIVKNKD